MGTSQNSNGLTKDSFLQYLFYSVYFCVLIALFVPISFVFFNNRIYHEKIHIWWLRTHSSSNGYGITQLTITNNYWIQAERHKLGFYNKLVKDGAFCSENKNLKYPLGKSTPHIYEPWIYDASLIENNEEILIVSIIISNRENCKFDYNKWKQAYLLLLSTPITTKSSLKLLKKDRNELHFDNSSIFMNVHKNVYTNDIKPIEVKLICKFYDNEMNMIGSVSSFKIVYDHLVRCPIPFDIKQNIKSNPNYRINIRLQLPQWPQQFHPNDKKELKSQKNNHRLLSNNNDENNNVLNNRKLIKNTHRKNDKNDYSYDTLPPLSKIFGVCPLPIIKKYNNNNNNNNNNNRNLDELSPFSSSHNILPIDEQENHRKLLTDSISNNHNKNDENFLYNFSMCSSLSSFNNNDLLEWIEYHRMIGVQHFFLYDTYYNRSSWKSSSHTINHAKKNVIPISISQISSKNLSRNNNNNNNNFPKNQKRLLSSLQNNNINTTINNNHKYNSNNRYNKKHKLSLKSFLKSYIEMGIVSIISWPYAECAESSLQCDDYIQLDESNNNKYNNKNNKKNDYFVPPKKLHTAELSCYNRFKRLTKWMIMIESDEFIGLNLTSRAFLQGNNENVNNNNGNSNSNNVDSTGPGIREDISRSYLNEFVNFYDNQYVNLASIQLNRLYYTSCEDYIIKDNHHKNLINNSISKSALLNDEDEVSNPRFSSYAYGSEISKISIMKRRTRVSIITPMVFFKTSSVVTYNYYENKIYVEYYLNRNTDYTNVESSTITEKNNYNSLIMMMRDGFRSFFTANNVSNQNTDNMTKRSLIPSTSHYRERVEAKKDSGFISFPNGNNVSNSFHDNHHASNDNNVNYHVAEIQLNEAHIMRF
eukprot:gene13671-18346_t